MKKLGFILIFALAFFVIPAYAAEGDYITVWNLDALNADPRGTTTNDTHMFVNDAIDEAVYIYDMDGTYITVWPLNANNLDCIGMGSNDTHIFVADLVDQQIYVYQMDGTYVTVWNLNVGNTVPYGVTTNGTTIMVVDLTDKEVYVYDMDGNYLSKWALKAPENANPYGITTNSIQNIWVSDSTDDAVYKYDMIGTYESTWALKAPENADPTDMTTNSSHIFVIDNNDDAVYVYEGIAPTAPVNLDLTSTATVLQYEQMWVNATVLDINGVADLNTVTIQVNTTGDAETFTLRWTQASNTFTEVSDPSNIVTLDAAGSVRENINVTADKIAFYFEITGGTIGLCDVRLTSIDDSALSDIDTYNNEFEVLLTYGPWMFSDTYYENGTLRVPPVNITVSGPGFTSEFNTSGGATVVFALNPTLFYWSIGAASRRIYSIGPENFTVTYPESTFDTYVFTVRDFTGKTALGDTYLEAWRVINGTDTLIERQIIDVHNEVPLNLVVGATYTIRVRYFDNSLFTWGQFVPGDSTIFTIVLRGVEITEQAYLVGNFLSVEITRPIPTQITVDYLTSRNTTIWSNVTVIIRGGAVVAIQSFNNESYTYNLGGLDADTSYTVLVEGEHTLQTEWAYSRTFDGTETYPDVPNIETIFPMAGLDGSNLIAWVFVLASGVTFSLIYRRAALIVMAAMASFFSAFGFADWNIFLLSLGWFFAIIVFLGSGDR